MNSPQHPYRIFFLLFALVLVLPFTSSRILTLSQSGVSSLAAATAADGTAAADQGSLTLVAPDAQPPDGNVLPGAAVQAVAFTLTNSGQTVDTVTDVTLHQSGTAPDTAISDIALVDTTVNFVAAEVSGSSLFSGANDATLHLPLALHLQPGESHAFVVWLTVPKDTPAANVGKTLQLDLTAIQSVPQTSGSALSGATYTIASGVTTPAPVCYMSLSPTVIPVGGSITIRWSSRNASAANITSIGDVSTSGSLNTLPSSAAHTTFVGTFTGAGGVAHCSATVSVSTGTGGYSTYAGGYDPATPSQPSALPVPDVPTKPGVPAVPAVPKVPAVLPVPTVTPPANTFNTTPGATVSAPAQPSGNLFGSLVPNCGASPAGGMGYSNVINGNVSVTLPQAVTATSCNLCDFGQLIQNIVNYLILITIPLSAGLFGWAGVLYFTARGDTHKIGEAHKIFRSVVMGFIIAISGYLVVQTILNGLLSKDFLGTFSWTQLQCYDPGHSDASIRPRSATIDQIFSSLYGQNSTYNVAVQNAQSVGAGAAGTTGGSKGTAQCADENTACSVATLQALNLTPNQANAMSCIAVTESSGNPNIGCSATATPCGLFQINNGNWDKYAPSDCRAYSQKSSASCNARTMAVMVNTPGVGYQPWTGSNPGQAPWNPAASDCVNKYDQYTSLNR